MSMTLPPSLVPPRTARFWVYVNTGPVRIKLRSGQELSWAEGGLTDEGFSYIGHCWSFDGDEVSYNVVTNARDCDGPISRGWSAFCKLDELRVIVSEDCPQIFPNWQERKHWQRDAYAEAAGY